MPVSLRRLLALALLAALAAAVLAGRSQPPAQAQSLAAERASAARLRAAVRAEEQRIAATRAGLAEAQQRLNALVARVQRRQAQLADTEGRLVEARVHLSRLQRKEATAKHTLRENLVASYKAGRPTFVGVVVDANGFADLVSRMEFVKRVSRRNASILDITRDARAAVFRQTGRLEDLRTRFSALAKSAIADRNQVAVLRGALLQREAQQLARRAGAAARLATVRARITRIERQQAAAARAAAAAASAADQAPRPPAGAGGGDVVARVVAAANQIATTPYVWGGGHGGASGGYDCSGSISYALAAGGLLASPLDSTGFMSWGAAGPGRRITVYANAGHAFMIVDGRRYDTSALSGGGTRWSSAGRSTGGFVARHPPGY